MIMIVREHECDIGYPLALTAKTGIGNVTDAASIS